MANDREEFEQYVNSVYQGSGGGPHTAEHRNALASYEGVQDTSQKYVVSNIPTGTRTPSDYIASAANNNGGRIGGGGGKSNGLNGLKLPTNSETREQFETDSKAQDLYKKYKAGLITKDEFEQQSGMTEADYLAKYVDSSTEPFHETTGTGIGNPFTALLKMQKANANADADNYYRQVKAGETSPELFEKLTGMSLEEYERSRGIPKPLAEPVIGTNGRVYTAESQKAVVQGPPLPQTGTQSYYTDVMDAIDKEAARTSQEEPFPSSRTPDSAVFGQQRGEAMANELSRREGQRRFTRDNSMTSAAPSSTGFGTGNFAGVKTDRPQPEPEPDYKEMTGYNNSAEKFIDETKSELASMAEEGLSSQEQKAFRDWKLLHPGKTLDDYYRVFPDRKPVQENPYITNAESRSLDSRDDYTKQITPEEQAIIDEYKRRVQTSKEQAEWQRNYVENSSPNELASDYQFVYNRYLALGKSPEEASQLALEEIYGDSSIQPPGIATQRIPDAASFGQQRGEITAAELERMSEESKKKAIQDIQDAFVASGSMTSNDPASTGFGTGNFAGVGSEILESRNSGANRAEKLSPPGKKETTAPSANNASVTGVSGPFAGSDWRNTEQQSAALPPKNGRVYNGESQKAQAPSSEEQAFLSQFNSEFSAAKARMPNASDIAIADMILFNEQQRSGGYSPYLRWLEEKIGQ